MRSCEVPLKIGGDMHRHYHVEIESFPVALAGFGSYSYPSRMQQNNLIATDMEKLA